MRAVTLLDRGVQRVRRDLAGRPDLQAALFHDLAVIYTEQGFYDRARPLALEAYRIRRERLGERDPETLQSLQTIGVLRGMAGSGEAGAGLRDLAAVTLGREAALGEADSLTLQSLSMQAGVAARTGQFRAADSLVGVLDRRAPADDGSQSAALIQRGRVEALAIANEGARAFEAAPAMLAAVERAFGPDHAAFADALDVTGQAALRAGRFDVAVGHHERAVALQRRLGLGDAALAPLLSNYGLALKQMGRLADAERAYREALDRFPADADGRLSAQNNLAGLLADRGAYAQAEPLYQAVIRSRRALGPEAAPTLVATENNLARLYLDAGDPARAEAAYRALRPRVVAVFGEAHPALAFMLNNLGASVAAQGRAAEAEGVFRESVRRHEQTVGPDHVRTANPLVGLAEALAAQDRPADAEPVARRALALRRASLPADHWQVAEARCALAASLAERDPTEARRLLRQALAAVGDAPGDAAAVAERARQRLTALGE